MINKIIMLICATLLCGTIGAQKITVDKVPSSVTSSFNSRFPSVTKTTWKIDKNKNYVAEFRMNEKNESAEFYPSGSWLKTDTAIKTSELPEAVKTTVSKEFTGYTIDAACKMENADHANGYEVELSKGKSALDVVLSAKGVVMTREVDNRETTATD